MKGISVGEQEQLDNMMIEMDGTENKCKSEIQIHSWTPNTFSLLYHLYNIW